MNQTIVTVACSTDKFLHITLGEVERVAELKEKRSARPRTSSFHRGRVRRGAMTLQSLCYCEEGISGPQKQRASWPSGHTCHSSQLGKTSLQGTVYPGGLEGWQFPTVGVKRMFTYRLLLVGFCTENATSTPAIFRIQVSHLKEHPRQPHHLPAQFHCQCFLQNGKHMSSCLFQDPEKPQLLQSYIITSIQKQKMLHSVSNSFFMKLLLDQNFPESKYSSPKFTRSLNDIFYSVLYFCQLSFVKKSLLF